MDTDWNRTFLRSCNAGCSSGASYYSLSALAKSGFGSFSRLPVSLRVVLETLLRNCDERRVLRMHVEAVANWRPQATREVEIPFLPGRLVLNCAAGIPVLADLAALRSEISDRGGSPRSIEPQVPVDMVLDHTLSVDFHAIPDANQRNLDLDFERNRERYQFVKWAMQAFRGIRLIPPGAGILHQLNLEFLAPGMLQRDGICFPDSLVGTDSHTCMIAAMGVVGWGVGGIEAAAAILGQPVSMLIPDVVGVYLSGTMQHGVTATDLVLSITQLLRTADVVGKFVEFFGPGVAGLPIPDRATVSNMAVEYGATIGYFALDERTCEYLRATGRDAAQVAAVETLYRSLGCFGAAAEGEVEYTSVLRIDLSQIQACVAGPRRPQDRVAISDLRESFREILHRPAEQGGYGRASAISVQAGDRVRDGDIVIAAIASCTSTSNPAMMFAAGLVAKKAVERGLSVKPWVKTSFTPGSTVVERYLQQQGLQPFLDQLGFHIAGFGCATCFGASGALNGQIEDQLAGTDTVACAVLSGNRNFEGRIHPLVRAAFLASPPMIVAFAIAGHVDVDFEVEPLGYDPDQRPVFLRDLWPDAGELNSVMNAGLSRAMFQEIYSQDFGQLNPRWASIEYERGDVYPWRTDSTYIVRPPFLRPELRRSVLSDIHGARSLVIVGDSVTTDHISPIGRINSKSPAGEYLRSRGVSELDFNNFGARRMNHEVMLRGVFSSNRLRNRMLPGTEGGLTVHHDSDQPMTVFEAAMLYQEQGTPLVVVAGREYGTGSARDWAAKATRLCGVRAVIASSFERIHRGNLVRMGVLPCELPGGVDAVSLRLDGSERFDLVGFSDEVAPFQPLQLRIHSSRGTVETVHVTLRLDTRTEIEYACSGGILPWLSGEMSRGSID